MSPELSMILNLFAIVEQFFDESEAPFTTDQLAVVEDMRRKVSEQVTA